MARKRMIDPNVWQDEDFGRLSITAKLLFIGLFSNADDYGRIRANPQYIKSTIFMYDEIELSTITVAISEVCEIMKSVKYYEVQKKPYIQLLKWNEYQKQHKDRIQDSLIPPMPSDACPTMSDNVGQVTDNVRGVKRSVDKVSVVKTSVGEYEGGLSGVNAGGIERLRNKMKSL